MNTLWQTRFVGKPVLFLVCTIPFLHVVADLFGVGGTLGTNPIEEIQDRFGIWGLRFIMITLAVTPLRQSTGWNSLGLFRRMLGLFAFFYVFMHFLTWLVLDQEMLWPAIAEDIFERPFITIGFAALVILLALAATSPLAARRCLGRRWQKLHNWVYVAAVLGVWHYWWQVKQDVSEPLLYAAILAVLLAYRGWRRWLRAGIRKR